MAIKIFEIKKYNIKIGYELSGGGGGPKSRGLISCRGEDGERFTIYFAAPGSEMAPPLYFPDKKIGSINIPVKEMLHYVDLLRNEKPVYAYLNSDQPEWNHIFTSLEAVGEGESRGA